MIRVCTRKVSLGVLGAVLAFAANAQAQTPSVTGYTLVSQKAVTRTVYEFTYRATLANPGGAMQSASAVVTSSSAVTTVVDGAVSFGPVVAGGTAVSLDTFSFRHDRTLAFNPAVLNWTVVPIRANRAPTASAVAKGAPYVVGQLVSLDGHDSADPDGDPLTYSWNLTRRPNTSRSELTATTPDTVLSLDVPGTYVASLTVSDGQASDTATIVVTTSNSSPVARAGQDQTVHVGGVAQLDGAGSTDADGDSLSFYWTLVVRPESSRASLANATSPTPSLSVDTPGTYRVRLVVDDAHGSSSQPDEVVISTLNSPPVAVAGRDQTVARGTAVTVNGDASTDVDGDRLSYLWVVLAAPVGSSVVLADPTAVSQSFIADRRGDYLLRLTVSDGLAWSSDAVIVTTENSGPLADAGPDQSAPLGSPVRLDGRASSDADGDTLTYAWALTHAPAGSYASLDDPTAVRPSFVVDEAGLYIVQLTVSDGLQSSPADTVSISTENSRPVADAGADRSLVVGQPIELDGTASSDRDHDPLSFRWAVVSGPPDAHPTLTAETTSQPTFVTDTPGTYVVQLIVRDAVLDSVPDTVTVSATNTAPRASAGADVVVRPAENVTLDGSGSSDAEGQALSYQWVVVHVPVGSAVAALTKPTTVTPTLTPDVAGDYVLQLVVSDGYLSSDPDAVIVTANSAPVANAGPDAVGAVAAETVLDGSASTDPDGDPLSFSWTLVDSPLGSTATVVNRDTSHPALTPDLQGDYTLALVVSDAHATSTPDHVTVHVAAANHAPFAVDDVVTTSPGVPTVIHVLANDGDPDLDPLAVADVTAAAAGTAAVNGDGTITFTPPDQWSGVARFTYRVSDGGLLSAPAEVLVVVAGPEPADLDPQTADVDDDGVVTLADVALVETAFGSSVGDGRYLDGLDLDGDAVIDATDVGIVSRRIGTTGVPTGPGRLAGRVVDDVGNGLAGVEVVLGSGASTTTDEGGVYALDVPVGQTGRNTVSFRSGGAVDLTAEGSGRFISALDLPVFVQGGIVSRFRLIVLPEIDATGALTLDNSNSGENPDGSRTLVGAAMVANTGMSLSLPVGTIVRFPAGSPHQLTLTRLATDALPLPLVLERRPALMFAAEPAGFVIDAPEGTALRFAFENAFLLSPGDLPELIGAAGGTYERRATCRVEDVDRDGATRDPDDLIVCDLEAPPSNQAGMLEDLPAGRHGGPFEPGWGWPERSSGPVTIGQGYVWGVVPPPAPKPDPIPCAYTLKGRVGLYGFTPIAGATISIAGLPPVTTGSDGRFTFAKVPGYCTSFFDRFVDMLGISVSAPLPGGRRIDTVVNAIRQDKGTVHDLGWININPSGTVAGRARLLTRISPLQVLPLPATEVVLTAAGLTEQRVSTDIAGGYGIYLADVLQTPYAVSADFGGNVQPPSGGAAIPVTLHGASSGAFERPGEVRLHDFAFIPTGAVRVHVHDKDNVPAGGLQVTLDVVGGLFAQRFLVSPREGAFTATTASDGWVTFGASGAGVPLGPCVIHVVQPATGLEVATLDATSGCMVNEIGQVSVVDAVVGLDPMPADAVAISPATRTMSSLSTASLAVVLGSPAPVGGVTVTIESSDATRVSAPAAVTIPKGARSAVLTVSSSTASGAVTLTPRASGWSSRAATVTVNGRVMSLVPAANPVSVGANPLVTLALASPAPSGGVRITLESTDPTAATITPAIVFVAEGDTSPVDTIRIDVPSFPMPPKSTTIRASATGFVTSEVVFKVLNAVSIPRSLNVPYRQEVSLPISITPGVAPSPDGLDILLTSDNAALEIRTPLVHMAPGASTVNGLVFGAFPGTATALARGELLVGSSTLVSVTANLNIVETSVSATPGLTEPSVTVRLESSGQGAVAPAGGLLVTFTSSNAACVSVSPATIPAGLVSVAAVPTYGEAVRPCTATVTAASSAGITSDSVAFQVNAPPQLQVRGNCTQCPTVDPVGVGLQNSQTAPYGNASISQVVFGTAVPAGGGVLKLRSSNRAVALVVPTGAAGEVCLPADTQDAGCSIDVPVAAGLQSQRFVIQGLAAGQFTVTASMAKYADGAGTVSVVNPSVSWWTAPPATLTTLQTPVVVIPAVSFGTLVTACSQVARSGGGGVQVSLSSVASDGSSVAPVQFLTDQTAGSTVPSATLTIPERECVSYSIIPTPPDSKRWVALKAVASGAADLRVLLGGNGPAATRVTASAPQLMIRGLYSTSLVDAVGVGLQTSQTGNSTPSITQVFFDTNSPVPTGGADLTVESADASLATLAWMETASDPASCSPTVGGGCSITKRIAAGTRNVRFVIRGIAKGTVQLRAKMNPYVDGTADVSVVAPSVLWATPPPTTITTIQGPYVITPMLSVPTNSYPCTQVVRAGSGGLAVNLTSSPADPNVAVPSVQFITDQTAGTTVSATTVTIPELVCYTYGAIPTPPESQHWVAVKAVGNGVANVRVSIGGVGPTAIPVTASAPQLLLGGTYVNNPVPQVGVGLQTSQTAYSTPSMTQVFFDTNSPVPIGGADLTIESADASLATLAWMETAGNPASCMPTAGGGCSIAQRIAAGTRSIRFVIRGMAKGAVQLRATMAGYGDATATVTISDPAVSWFTGPPATMTTLQAPYEVYAGVSDCTQVVRAGSPGLPIELASQIEPVEPIAPTVPVVFVTPATSGGAPAATVMVPPGQCTPSDRVSLKVVAAGTARITARVGANGPTNLVKVSAPVLKIGGLCDGCAVDAVGVGLQNSQGLSFGNVSQSNVYFETAVPAGGGTLHVESSNKAVARVLPTGASVDAECLDGADANTCSFDIVVPAGTRSFRFITRGMDQPGTVMVTARMSGYVDGGSSVSIVPPVLGYYYGSTPPTTMTPNQSPFLIDPVLGGAGMSAPCGQVVRPGGSLQIQLHTVIPVANPQPTELSVLLVTTAAPTGTDTVSLTIPALQCRPPLTVSVKPRALDALGPTRIVLSSPADATISAVSNTVTVQ